MSSFNPFSSMNRWFMSLKKGGRKFGWMRDFILIPTICYILKNKLIMYQTLKRLEILLPSWSQNVLKLSWVRNFLAFYFKKKRLMILFKLLKLLRLKKIYFLKTVPDFQYQLLLVWLFLVVQAVLNSHKRD